MSKLKKVKAAIYLDKDVYTHLKLYAAVIRTSSSAFVNEHLKMFFELTEFWQENIQDFDIQKIKQDKLLLDKLTQKEAERSIKHLKEVEAVENRVINSYPSLIETKKKERDELLKKLEKITKQLSGLEKGQIEIDNFGTKVDNMKNKALQRLKTLQKKDSDK